MKTAMQTLLDYIDTMPFYGSPDHSHLVNLIQQELLDKEKEQIQEAYLQGFGRGLLADNTKPSQTHEQYYTKTYNHE